jgi:hypothetical protein
VRLGEISVFPLTILIMDVQHVLTTYNCHRKVDIRVRKANTSAGGLNSLLSTGLIFEGLVNSIYGAGPAIAPRPTSAPA